MGRKQVETTLELRTRLFVAELDDGLELCFPLADPTLISHGRNGSALAEQRLFLEEYLPDQPPDLLARFATPGEAALVELDVVVPREDLPARLQLSTPVRFAAVLLPQGRDRWVFVPALGHTFHVAPGEELEPVVKAEVRRMVAAREPTPLELAAFLPPVRSQRLEEIVLGLDRSASLVPGTARTLRRRVIQRKQQADALEVLGSVGLPLHESPDLLRGPPLVGRERELKLLDGLLGGRQRPGVMLVGSSLTGKSALLRGWLRRCHERGESRLVFSTSAAQLVAGMSGLGQWQERARRVMLAAEHLDAVLYFDSLGDLFSDRPEGKVDLAGAMRPYLEEGRVRLVGEVRPEALDLYESRHVGLISLLQRVRLEPMDARGGAAVLEGRVEHAARHEPHRPCLAREAVGKLVDLVDRYQPYQSHPGKGVRLFEELRAVHEHRQRRQEDWDDEPEWIGEDELLDIFALQSGIPLFLLRQDQALKLEQVVAGLGRRVIGQERAVRRVAETVCTVKANLQPAGKPLATFLFVGPTGVGKTELARSLAAFLFSSADRLLRFDMSEFMDPGAAQRLIQGSDRAEGMLTHRVRQQPFCVLLLDEIEKAHPAVFDLLLQVCGEGRLSDAAGRTTHFDNTMIIMTSNLGAAGRRTPIGVGPRQLDEERYYEEQVARLFRPELVNRLDRVISFHALSPAQAAEVARLTVAQVARRRGLAESQLELDVSEGALAALARGGYSETYGARQLRRHVEDRLVAPAARMLADLGGRARGGRLAVRLVGEETTTRPGSRLASLTSGELTLEILRRPARAAQRGAGADSLHDLSALRREVGRMTSLELVSEVKDQIELCVTQLSSGDERGGAARVSGALRAELHLLQQVWRRAEILRTDVETAEEMALTAIFEDEDPAEYVREAAGVFDRFLEALFYLLVVRRPHRDQATLLLQELDEGRALDHWLVPLLERGLEPRGWSATLHVDGGERSAADRWPEERRWGPPRDAGWALDRLRLAKRPFRNLLLRVGGPWAGVCLALEQGTHRYEGVVAGKPVQHAVELIARHTELSDLEWLDERILPLPPDGLAGLRRRTPTRRYETPEGPCHLLGKRRTVDVPLDRYWEKLEILAVHHLLARLDTDEDDDLDDLFLARLPDRGGR